MTEPTDKQIAEAAAFADLFGSVLDDAESNLLRIEGEWGSCRSFEHLIEAGDNEAIAIRDARAALAALAARQVPEDVAALVARLRDYANDNGLDPETRLEIATALEVSSRTVAPNRGEAVRLILGVLHPDATRNFPMANDYAHRIFDALADLWQPAPVIDREALRQAVEEAVERWADAYPAPQVYDVLTDALLPFIGQPASPRTVTTVEEDTRRREAEAEALAIHDRNLG